MQDSKVSPVAVAGVVAGVALIAMSVLGLTGVLPMAESYRPALYVGVALGAVNIFRGLTAIKRK